MLTLVFDSIEMSNKIRKENSQIIPSCKLEIYEKRYFKDL